MASILQGKCSACGETTSEVIGSYLACRLDSGDFVPLAHPGESYALNKLGFTMREAKNQGRLLSFECVTCDNCGELDYRPIAVGRGTAGDLRTSCLSYITIWIICFWSCGQIHAIPLLLRVPAGLFTAIAASWILGVARERAFRLAETSRSETEVCKQCRGDLFSRVSMDSISMCPVCKNKTMHYRRIFPGRYPTLPIQGDNRVVYLAVDILLCHHQAAVAPVLERTVGIGLHHRDGNHRLLVTF